MSAPEVAYEDELLSRIEVLEVDIAAIAEKVDRLLAMAQLAEVQLTAAVDKLRAFAATKLGKLLGP